MTVRFLTRTRITAVPGSRSGPLRDRCPRRSLLALAALIAALVCSEAASAQAVASPWWQLSSRAAPTNLAPGSEGLLIVGGEDIGDTGVSGAPSPVTISDVLPPGLSAVSAEAVSPHRSYTGYDGAGKAEEQAFWSCTVKELREISCQATLSIPAYEALEVEIPVRVSSGASPQEVNEVSISGGQAQQGGAAAPAASLRRTLSLSAQPTSFGIEPEGYSLLPEDEGGGLDSRAGSHPFQLTSTLDFNQTLEGLSGHHPEPGAPGLARNLSFALPPGLLGNVTAAQQCSEADFSALGAENTNFCPSGSAVGVALVSANVPNSFGYVTHAVPLFNLVPAHGEPARFGFVLLKVPVVLDTSLRSGSDYGVTVSVSNASEAAQVLGAKVTFWGWPGDPRHDSSRGWSCLLGGVYVHHETPCEPPSPRPSSALLTLPTSCTGALASTMSGEAWSGTQVRDQFSFQSAPEQQLQNLEGCAELPFEPSIAAQPEQSEGQAEGTPASAGASPTGLEADVKLPQAGTLEPGALGESDLERASVSLPVGMTLNPSAANGLQACSESQIGFQGSPGIDPLSPGAPQPLSFSEEEAHCPEASKVGTVQIKTPLLSEELSGAVYLAQPAPNGEGAQNPFNSLIALYITAESKALGIHVKLAGQGSLDPATGQITTTFSSTPQVPFEELRLQLFGGARGSLSTPPLCGGYDTQASFTPWSGGAAVQSASEFQITSGPGGSPCASDPLPFSPSFSAGSENLGAGAFSSFTVQIGHPDQDQPLNGISMRLPAGIAALLAKSTPCAEPPPGQEWSCGAESLLGYAKESAGLGSEPFTLTGQVYLTSGYGGAPFGLLVATEAKAGPFDLGMVDVRSKIEVDPHTAQVTIQSDPGPRGEAIPTMLKGVPVDLKDLEVVVDRPSFEFNPTSCDQKKIEATLSGAGGAQAQLSEPFQVQGCQSLPFKPTLTAQTEGRTSKANGASFLVKVSSTQGQANIAKTVLQVPKILPARLSTIQKACLAKTFEANPASCPEGSNIGQGIAHTPVLRSTLQGPAYLVSHGNAAWPDVEFVLQGEGITLILDGQTAIKGGVTTSSFNTVPDAPVSSFEAILPEGPHSALTTDLPPKAHYSLCGQKLLVPTTLTGQNGAVIKQSTKVSVSGCGAVKAAKAKKLSRAQKLKRALASCRRRYRHSKARRQSCEHKARRRFGPKKGKGKAAERGHAHGD